MRLGKGDFLAHETGRAFNREKLAIKRGDGEGDPHLSGGKLLHALP